MNLHWIDHLFVFLLVAVFPIWDRFEMKRDAARIEAGVEGARRRLYRRILVEEWSGLAVLAVAWWWLGRSATWLGLSAGGGRFVVAGYILTAACVAGLAWQLRGVLRSDRNRAAFREAVGDQRFLMPSHAGELRGFAWVSIAAGVCEEIVYRGFLIAYVSAALNASFWIAAALSSIAFGLAHAYQGPSGIVRTGLAGAVFATLYGLTGALWAPIAVHILMDWWAGRTALAVFADPPVGDAQPEAA